MFTCTGGELFQYVLMHWPCLHLPHVLFHGRMECSQGGKFNILPFFCDHLSRPMIWRDFPFHTSLVCSETVRRWCHWTQILFPSLLFICALVYFFAVDCSLHKAVNSTGIYCFASICRGRWFGTSLHVWSRASVSPVFFPRSHKNCTNPVCFRKIKTICVHICPQTPKVTIPLYLQVKHK